MPGSLSLTTWCGGPLRIPPCRPFGGAFGPLGDFGRARPWGARSRPGTQRGLWSRHALRLLSRPRKQRGLWSRHTLGRPVAPPEPKGTLVAPHAGDSCRAHGNRGDFGRTTPWGARSHPQKHGTIWVASPSGALGRAPQKYEGTLVAPHPGRPVARGGALGRAPPEQEAAPAPDGARRT